jgi:hypothetical protein
MTTDPWATTDHNPNTSRPPAPDSAENSPDAGQHAADTSAWDRLRRALSLLRQHQQQIGAAWDRGDCGEARRLEESEIGLLQDVADAAHALI